MNILYLLLPIGIVFLIFAIIFFFWAIRNGQYDDMQSQALKVVMDDHIEKKPKNTTKVDENIETNLTSERDS